MIEHLSPRVYFAVFGPDLSYDDGFPAVTDNAFQRFSVSGGKTIAAFSVAVPDSGGWDDPIDYETHLRRYLADGTLDKTFGRQGDLNIGLSTTPHLVPGQRIIVASNETSLLRAYTLNGRVDTTFGGGDGVAEIPTGNTTNYYLNARLSAVLDDGSLLTQAQIHASPHDPDGKKYRNVIARLTPNGTLDPNFGTNGAITYRTGYADVTPLLTAKALYLLNDYLYQPDGTTGSDIIKLSPDGKTADTSFGGDGRVAIPGFVDNLVEQPDGKLLFLDNKYNDERTLYRLNLDGSPDTSFSGDGKVAIAYTGSDSGLPLSSSGERVLIDGQNRIVVSADNSIFRFSPSGTLDAYPFNGTAPFPTLMVSIDDAGNVIGGDRKRYGLVLPQQIGADGVIKITSDNRDDVIDITDASLSRIRVVVNGESKLFRVRDVRGFDVQTYDGDLSFDTDLGWPVTLRGGNGDADLMMGDGNDDIELGTGDHTMYLGSGDDTVRIGSVPPVNAETDPNLDDQQTITAISGNKKIEFYNGTANINLGVGNHEINGFREVHDNVINIVGGNNSVRLAGNGGDKITIGGKGANDVTVFGPNVSVTTGVGPDKILAISPYGTINTTGGNDEVTIRTFGTNPTRGVTVYAGSGDDHVFCDDTYQSLATVYGGAGNDLLEGNVLSQRLYGENGNDTLNGGDGNDYLFGGDLDDVIIGGASSDRLYGEAGNDKLYGQSGNDTLSGGDGDDYLFAQNGRDILYGDAGRDRFYAEDNKGPYALYGGASNDLFFTRNGVVDSLYGGNGQNFAEADENDRLERILGA